MAKPDCERYLRNRIIMQQRYPSLLTAEETKNLYLAMFNGHEDRNNKHVSRLLRKSDRMIAREPDLSNAGFYDAVKDVARVAQAVDFEEWARSQKVPAHIAREIRSGVPSSDVYWEWLIGEADRVWRRWMTSLDSYPGPSKIGWVSDIKNALGDVSQRPWELFVYAEPNAMSRFHQHDPHGYFRWLSSGSHGVEWAIKNGFLVRADFAEHDSGPTTETWQAINREAINRALEVTERCHAVMTESLPAPKHAGRMGDGFKVGEHVIRIGDMIKMEGQLGGYVENVDRSKGIARVEQDNGETKPWPLASLLHDTKANRERQQEHNDKINAEAEARLELSLADWRAR